MNFFDKDFMIIDKKRKLKKFVKNFVEIFVEF